MKFSLIINGGPYSSQAALTAYNYASAILSGDHEIYRLFFYQEGVYNASSLVVPPQDEFDLPTAWQTLIEQNNLDAVVCVSSALKRGILDEAEAQRYEKGDANLLPGFQISGLGQLIDAQINSDRVVNFLG